MHNEIRYTGKGRVERAIIDVIKWLGCAKFRRVVRDMRAIAKHEGLHPTQVRMMFGIGGIQGYPVEVIWDVYIQPVNKIKAEW